MKNNRFTQILDVFFCIFRGKVVPLQLNEIEHTQHPSIRHRDLHRAG